MGKELPDKFLVFKIGKIFGSAIYFKKNIIQKLYSGKNTLILR